MASTNENTNRKDSLKAKINTLTKYLIELQNELDELENKESVLKTDSVSNTVSPFGPDLVINNFYKYKSPKYLPGGSAFITNGKPPQSFFGGNGFIANNFYKPSQSLFGGSYFIANNNFYEPPSCVSNQAVNTHQPSSLDTTKIDSTDSSYFAFSNKDTHYV